MEEQKDILGLLDLMVQPAFCVKENRIIRVNAAAKQLFLTEGDPLEPLLLTGAVEYREFTEGCLYLSLSLCGSTVGAAVRRMEDMDIFLPETDSGNDALRTVALAACALRRPLSTALSSTADLLSRQEEPEALEQLTQLSRSLHQMLRLVGNMSDADPACFPGRMETVDAGMFLQEVFQKARDLLEHTGITLRYQDRMEPVYCLLNTQQLERAVLNLLSNAAKFTPKGGRIDADLTRRGRTLQLTIQDTGSGIAGEVMGTLFQRYLRQPGIEDSRFGLGLGIRMVHTAAQSHGGTLLVGRGEAGGTRIVLTLAIHQREQTSLHSPGFELDYTGGFDHALVELSDCLPDFLYDGSF